VRVQPSGEPDLVDRVREACSRVAARSRSVRIEEEALGALALALDAIAPAPPEPAAELPVDGREAGAAFVLCLDAINFGSGWWPTISKRAGLSGYATIAAGIEGRFRAAGPWPAAELSELDAAAIAGAVGQDPEHPLMADYAAALRDVGEHVAAEHDGRFAGVLDAATGSAPALAELLAAWEAFADASTYEGRPVPFFKRAQIAAADIDRMGVAGLRDVNRLTAFADNLVPHVLRLDGVLRLAPELEARVEAGELLEHGSAEEVELRACAVQAVEQLAGSTPLCPAQVDALLWHRGGAPAYKSVPRPRSRNTAY
jgi:hypothetical protein